MNGELYIGLMSGTSADSLDAVLVDFAHSKPNIVSTYTLPIPSETRKRVHKLAISGVNEIDQLRYLDRENALLASKAITSLLEQIPSPPHMIKAVGSHGQTIRHYPTEQENIGYSLQVGDPNIIAEYTGITTVADFRRRDIAAGGQGAPLAPAFHQALFQSPNHARIIVNLGGTANITLLPSHGTTRGYDTGPANGLMDSWCQKHKQQAYDNDGQWASSGTMNPSLLNRCLQHPFFSQPSPKSTGREDFNLPWVEQLISSLDTPIAIEDVQATLLQLTIESIAQAIEFEDTSATAEIYLCGGGAHNKALCNSLSTRLHPRNIQTTQELGIHPDWVEAVAFAWLAKQTMDKAHGNLPSVTGAHKSVILGGIYLGDQ